MNLPYPHIPLMDSKKPNFLNQLFVKYIILEEKFVDSSILLQTHGNSFGDVSELYIFLSPAWNRESVAFGRTYLSMTMR